MLRQWLGEDMLLAFKEVIIATTPVSTDGIEDWGAEAVGLIVVQLLAVQPVASGDILAMGKELHHLRQHLLGPRILAVRQHHRYPAGVGRVVAIVFAGNRIWSDRLGRMLANPGKVWDETGLVLLTEGQQVV